MTFKQYLAESEKTYCYRLKTVSILDKNAVSIISKYFQRFNLKSISDVVKTPLQKTPLDFESVSNREVFILDFSLGLPISGFVMQRELVGLLGLPGDYLLIRGENDPIEIQTDVMQQTADIQAQALKKNLTASTVMDVKCEYPEADQTADGSNYYGDNYNSRLMACLRDIADERLLLQQVNAKAPLFSWLNMPQDDKNKTPSIETDFNFNHKISLIPATVGARQIGKNGNFDDEGVIVKQTYLDKNQKAVTLTGTPFSIRNQE